jgi:hypothetical protein
VVTVNVRAFIIWYVILLHAAGALIEIYEAAKSTTRKVTPGMTVAIVVHNALVAVALAVWVL